jgi:hypothetical protein
MKSPRQFEAVETPPDLWIVNVKPLHLLAFAVAHTTAQTGRPLAKCPKAGNPVPRNANGAERINGKELGSLLPLASGLFVDLQLNFDNPLAAVNQC